MEIAPPSSPRGETPSDVEQNPPFPVPKSRAPVSSPQRALSPFKGTLRSVHNQCGRSVEIIRDRLASGNARTK